MVILSSETKVPLSLSTSPLPSVWLGQMIKVCAKNGNEDVDELEKLVRNKGTITLENRTAEVFTSFYT